jgi:tetratricopeptide (TPR) repeat protein
MTSKTKASPSNDLSEKAWRAYRAEDFPAAARAFDEAAAAFSGAGDALASAEMKNNQSVALLRAKQASAALEAAKGTEAVFAAAGDFRREGMAFANQASALDALKRKKEAVDFYQQAAAALEKAGEGDLRAEVMQLLSMHYLRRGKFYDAVISLQSALAGVKNPTPKQRFMKKILFIRL